jgi:hypothetical protein
MAGPSLQPSRLSRIRDLEGAFERSQHDQPSSDPAVSPSTPGAVAKADLLHAMHCHACWFRPMVSRQVWLPQIRAVLASGDV